MTPDCSSLECLQDPGTQVPNSAPPRDLRQQNSHLSVGATPFTGVVGGRGSHEDQLRSFTCMVEPCVFPAYNRCSPDIAMIIIMTEGLCGTQLDWPALGMRTYGLEHRGPEVRVRTRRENGAQRSVLIPGLRSV